MLRYAILGLRRMVEPRHKAGRSRIGKSIKPTLSVAIRWCSSAEWCWSSTGAASHSAASDRSSRRRCARWSTDSSSASRSASKPCTSSASPGTSKRRCTYSSRSCATRPAIKWVPRPRTSFHKPSRHDLPKSMPTSTLAEKKIIPVGRYSLLKGCCWMVSLSFSI